MWGCAVVAQWCLPWELGTRAGGLGQHWLLLLLSQNLPFTREKLVLPEGGIYLRVLPSSGRHRSRFLASASMAPVGTDNPVTNRNKGLSRPTVESVCVPKHKKREMPWTNGDGCTVVLATLG